MTDSIIGPSADRVIGDLRLYLETSKQEELRARTKKFALRIIRLFQRLPRSAEAQVLGKQLLRSGTSIGANYRVAGRARSQAEFTSKIGIVVEDETVLWLECLGDSGIVKEELLLELLKEANELLATFAASHRTSRRIRPDHPMTPMTR